MSSVFGLNANPNTAICLPFTTHNARRIFSIKRSMRGLLMFSDSFSMEKSTPDYSSKPNPGVKETGSNPRIHSHRAHHLLDIGAQFLRQVSHHIRVRDLNR